MIRKILVTASLSGLLMGAPVIVEAQGQAQPGQQGQQSQQAAKSVTGKVTDIGDQGHSFTVTAGTNGQTMKFVVDKNTQVQGQVKVGTTVAVDYQPMDGGQFLCVRVAAQNG